MKQQQGISMLSFLFILSISSLFIFVVTDNTKLTNELKVPIMFDALKAQNIAEIGAYFANQEILNNNNLATNYTSGTPALNNVEYLDGNLTVTFTGDLTNKPITIESIGSYNNTKKVIRYTVY